MERPMKNAPFCPIRALGPNFNPGNTECMSVVKIFAWLGLGSRLNIKCEYNGSGKIEHFSKGSKI